MFNRGHYKQLEDTPTGPAVKARNPQGGPTYAVAGADAKSFTTDFLADKTVDFIRAHQDRPFCFVTSVPDPHGPNTVRPPYDTLFAALKFRQPHSAFESGSGLPSCAVPPAKPRFENMRHYFGMVKCIDDNVGIACSISTPTRSRCITSSRSRPPGKRCARWRRPWRIMHDAARTRTPTSRPSAPISPGRPQVRGRMLPRDATSSKPRPSEPVMRMTTRNPIPATIFAGAPALLPRRSARMMGRFRSPENGRNAGPQRPCPANSSDSRMRSRS
jgi:hypothetical protein